MLFAFVSYANKLPHELTQWQLEYIDLIAKVYEFFFFYERIKKVFGAIRFEGVIKSFRFGAFLSRGERLTSVFGIESNARTAMFLETI